MNRRTFAIVVALLGVLAAAWLLKPSRPPTDEELIRAAIHDMARKAEARDVSGLVEHVSERYAGEAGDRQTLKSYLAGYILRSDWVSVVEARVQVEVTGTTAKSRFLVLLSRSPAKSEAEVRPDAVAGSHEIEATWTKEDSGWKVLDAKRKDAGAAEWVR